MDFFGNGFVFQFVNLFLEMIYRDYGELCCSFQNSCKKKEEGNVLFKRRTHNILFTATRSD